MYHGFSYTEYNVFYFIVRKYQQNEIENLIPKIFPDHIEKHILLFLLYKNEQNSKTLK